MPRLPPTPAPLVISITEDRPIISGKDILTLLHTALPPAGSPRSPEEWSRRADEAAATIRNAVLSAVGQALVRENRLPPGAHAALARDVAAKTAALLRALGLDPEDAAAGSSLDDLPEAWLRHEELGMPVALDHLLGDLSAATPPVRPPPYGLQRMMADAPWFEAGVEARTNSGTTPESARAKEAVIAGMKALPDALGALLALARGAEAFAKQRQPSFGERENAFVPPLAKGMVQAFHIMFGAWPRPRADKLPAHGAEPVRWCRAVLVTLARNTRWVRGLDPERFYALLKLTDRRLANILIEAVALEARS